jgi:2-polyprenyl-3-methyl-5-hydroxy-6-metoxy-1,4-benzoquinol methylase
MNSFDEHARLWDAEKIHQERSAAIAKALEKMVPVNASWKAMEYGAGTGILSFLLKDKLSEILLIDNSKEMIAICREKAAHNHTRNIHPLFYDLEHSDYNGEFDLIYNQMVLHHVKNVSLIFDKFYNLLSPGGYLAVADLYTEDGSFHGENQDVHKGFDPEELSQLLKEKGFIKTAFMPCFEIERDSNKYPLFLLTAQKKKY